MDDDFAETIRWLTDVVYLHTIVEGTDLKVKDVLIRKWTNPNYTLPPEEERFLKIILEQGIKDEQQEDGSS